MEKIPTSVPGVFLVKPEPDRDAAFAYRWFSSESGRDTLLGMGNAPSEITPPTMEGERSTLESFLRLESEHKQLTWMIRKADTTIGAAWIELIKNHSVEAPSIHVMIGDPSLRGKGIGKGVVKALLDYLRANKYKKVYSRHLTSNIVIANLFEYFDFQRMGPPYVDENGLEWQNIEKSLEA